MTAEDIATVLSAVGDSWPAAIVVVAVVAGVIAVRALPKLKDITESLSVLRHEMRPNSGKTIRDVMDRIEKKVDTHIEEDATWKAGIEEHLTSGP